MDYPIFGFVLFSFFLACSVECAILQALQYDHSFQQFCEGYSGSYTKRKDLDKAIIGDVCILTISKAGLNVDDNQKRMRNHCKNWYPYHLRSVKNIDGNSFSCELENPHICNRGWVYIDGGCYRLMGTNSHSNFYVATKWCEHADATLPHDRYNLGGWLDLYYPEMSQIWMLDVDSPLTEIYEKNLTQAATIIAYGSANTWSTSWAMPVQINKKELALVVCEYFPPSTPPSRRILTERLKPIMKIDFTREEIFVTTTNRYGRYGDNMKSYDKICEGFQHMFKTLAIGFVPFEPSRNALEDMTQTILEKGPVRVPVEVYPREKVVKATKQVECSRKTFIANEISGFKNGEKKYTLGEPVYTSSWMRPIQSTDCEIITSGAIVWSGEKKVQMDLISDAHRAPILCSSLLKNVSPKPRLCEPGDVTFDRPTGERVCFFLMLGKKWWDSQNRDCREEHGGVGLAGFETEEEFKVLKKLAGSKYVYLGARREQICRKKFPNGSGYDKENPDGPCGRRNVFFWYNGVASNSEESRNVMVKLWGNQHDEPNNGLGYEDCMEITGDHLNDNSCSSEREKGDGAICQRVPKIKPT